MYTQPGCKLCERSMQKLDDAGLEYNMIDLSEDPKALFYVTEVLECRTLPVIVSGKTVIRGFQPDQLKTLIEQLKKGDAE
ncbi:glutaredoxin family protein [Segniliparus rugosus]|uniref:glutaredoxin family protein n=1 Tax=Segniliparus rugosus TaxID=286804 RepID=UPI00244DAD0D|nr:glutaredoxin family protein [Segniliparus rugosus]